MLNNFYTYFDSHFLCRGLALYYSLSLYVKEFNLFVLCLDDKCFDAISRLSLPNITPVSIHQLEKDDIALSEVKQHRSKIEYYFSCTAAFGCYLFRHNPINFLTYLDGDTYFYSSPEAFLDTIQSYSIAITPHRFPSYKRENEKYGIYNVGWVSFKRDEEGLACLAKWREECLEWCYNRLEGERFGDQKYLDTWPKRYNNLKIIDHLGINAAPWNLEEVNVQVKDREIYINKDPLILFHFHNLYRVAANVYKLGLASYDVKINAIIKNYIYKPYVEHVKTIHKEIKNINKVAPGPHRGVFAKEFNYRNFWPLQDLLIYFN